jgi:hypothetical protein
MPLPCLPSLEQTQSITVQKGNDKMVRTHVILCFCPEIHSTLIIEAMAAWPTLIGHYCPHTILPTLLPPSSYRKVTQCQNIRPKGEVLMHFMFLSQKNIQLTYKLSLPLICNFSNQIYLLILIWDHHTIINGPWEHHTTKPMQNDATHNNQLVVTVSFFSIESVFPV